MTEMSLALVMSSKIMLPNVSFSDGAVIFKSPAMMIAGGFGGVWPCDEARAAASLCAFSRSSTRWAMDVTAHSAFQRNLAPLLLPGARWLPWPSMVWAFATRTRMPAGDTKSA